MSFNVVTISVIYFTGDQPFPQIEFTVTGDQPFFETDDQPFYETGDQRFPQTGNNPFYETSDQPFPPQTGNQPFPQTGDQPFPQTGDQPFPQTGNLPCAAVGFQCGDGTCIHFIQVCNGVLDCKLTGEDEDSLTCDHPDIDHSTYVDGGITNDGDEIKPSLSITGKITPSSNYCFVSIFFIVTVVFDYLYNAFSVYLLTYECKLIFVLQNIMYVNLLSKPGQKIPTLDTFLVLVSIKQGFGNK